MRDEIIISNLGALCIPQGNISDKRIKSKWTSYPYETGNVKGSMLLSPHDGNPEDVILFPEISGWYKIFVGMYCEWEGRCKVEMKLSEDGAFYTMSPTLGERYGEHYIEDVYWKCADMSGQSIVIGKHSSELYARDANVAWFRFVPMTDDEVMEYINDKKRTDTKRLYAADDMHNKLCFCNMSSDEAWRKTVQAYINTDVEWLAIEDLGRDAGKVTDCDVSEFSFAYNHQFDFYNGYKNYSYDTLKTVVDYGKENNIKMCISQRIAGWGMEYPEDKMFFENDFAKNHPEYRCVDRDGDITDYMSFAYPEVQDYIIDEFVKMAETGCDAVQPLFSRGWPYILFEKPFVDAFYEMYNEDARELPLDNPKIIKLKCRMMTEFIRRLRVKLDEVRKENPVEFHAKVLFSVYDNLLVGLDIEEWAREGLVDRIISDERRIREILDESIFDNGKINIEKYTEYARSCSENYIHYDYDDIFPPFPDSTGELKGPVNQKQRIAEFMELEKKYGITVYIEIMPRIMNTDEIKRKALEIYDSGCEHIALWDTETRSVRSSEWTMWRRIGHKNELEGFTNGSGELYSRHRLIKLGDKNIRGYKPIWTG